jgi:hypothetical protein
MVVIEGSLGLLHVGDDALPGQLAGDVVMEEAGFAAGPLDGRHHLLALEVLDVGDDDGGAFARQGLGAAGADAAGSAGDQRHLALDATHDLLLTAFAFAAVLHSGRGAPSLTRRHEEDR